MTDGMNNSQGTPKRVSGSATPQSPMMTPTTAQANQLLDMDRAFTELENFQQVHKFSFSVCLLGLRGAYHSSNHNFVPLDDMLYCGFSRLIAY